MSFSTSTSAEVAKMWLSIAPTSDCAAFFDVDKPMKVRNASILEQFIIPCLDTLRAIKY